tara:strand:- start:61 stop:1740 length:1680 start_codon:yes stop_codon:yes gene_type:complete
MNSLKIPQFIPGPPGTGKTHKWLKHKYMEFLKKYSWDRIVILSHTNTAAKEILKAVKNLPELVNTPDTNLEDQICTIHSYFRGEYILGIDKYEHKDHKKFCEENPGMKILKKKIKWDKHPLYEFISHAHGKGYKLDSEKELEDFWASCERSRYEGYRLHGPGGLLELKKQYDKYRENPKHRRVSFVDMIDNFRFKAEVPTDIDVLIVDEAQDCSKPQINALQIAATHTKEFIFIGDADQTIHEYAGSDPKYFYQLANTEEAKANELTEGLRCGQTINKICKNIIKPVWDKYGDYAKRKWTPTEDIGNSYWIPDLRQNCKAKDILIDRILNTEETFLFTYRGNPTHKNIIIPFLQDNGIDYKPVDSETAYVAREYFSCFKSWKTFLNDKVSLSQIKKYWKLIGSKVKVTGKGPVDKLKPLINRDYNIQELIDAGYLKPEVKEFQRFSQILTHEQLSKNGEKGNNLLAKIPYINKVLINKMDIDKNPRVEYGTIHKVKGLTFDNSIVDLSVYYTERGYEPIRLAYVAYSRAKKNCWSIGSSSPNGASLAGIQNNRRNILEL